MKYLSAICGLLLLVGCNKNKPLPPTVPDRYENGVLVLNEGLFEQNNASLTFYSGIDVYQQVFKSENNRGLGDTANDFEAFELNGNQYVIVAVDISSQLEIFSQTTLKSVAQIPLFDADGNAREPRVVKVIGDKAYSCNFDGTIAIIDLNIFKQIDLIHVGANPDGMAFSNDKLYVANSGGLHYPVYDSTVSVINLTTNTVEETFVTRINCTQIIADAYGDLYQVSNGNYGDISPALVRIDAATNAVQAISEMAISSLVLAGNWMYYYDKDAAAIKRFNSATESFDPATVVDLSDFETFHGFILDEVNNRFYCMDANGYVNSSSIRAYNLAGSFLFEFKAGLVSTDIIITP